MDEIKKLQEQLAAVQLKESSLRLSDRNVIDLIMKLKEMKAIELIYTLNAKELITPRQLQREMEDEIISNGGRMELSDLQFLMNVDFSYIDQGIDNLIQEKQEYQKLQNEVLTEVRPKIYHKFGSYIDPHIPSYSGISTESCKILMNRYKNQDKLQLGKLHNNMVDDHTQYIDQE